MLAEQRRDRTRQTVLEQVERLQAEVDAVHSPEIRPALDLARKIVEHWPPECRSTSGRSGSIASTASKLKKVSAEDRSHLAAFPEIVVLTHLILDPPTSALDPKALYLATTAELSRRFARIYTTLGTQDSLYRRFCLYRDRDFRESQVA